MEGLPNAMVEAMSAGLVPLVSAVGNVPSCLEDGKNGFCWSLKIRFPYKKL